MLFFINYAFNHKIITGEIMKRFTRLFLPLLLCVFFGTVFYMVSSEEAKNYPPVFLNPPSFVFPIAWTILYILIGVSIYLFDKLELSKEENDQVVILYYFDLFFNSTWTLLFFKLKLRVFSCFWLGALVLIALIRFFVMKKKNKISAYLLLPYIMWLMFALYLNIAIVLV